MAKIRDIKVELGNFMALYSSNVSVSIDKRLKNAKITKAMLTLDIKAIQIADGVGITVNYSYYKNNDRLGGWDNIEFITGVKQSDKIYLNFTDELQNAVNHNADKLIFYFVPDQNVDKYPFVQLEQDGEVDIRYISLNTFQENGISHKIDLGIGGEAKVDLATGALFVNTPIAKFSNNSLPYSLSLNYNYSNYDTEENDQNIGNKTWNFNFRQKLICEEQEQSLIFRYIDSEGKERFFDETYYYDDGNGEKQIDRMNDGMFVEPDGSLKFKDDNEKVYDVKKKLETSTNLKLVSSVADIPGGHLVDSEPEELINLRQQRKQYEEYIEDAKTAIDLNKKQLCSYALTKKVAQKQLLEQEDNVKNTNRLFELQKKIEDIKYRALIKNRCYRLTLSDDYAADKDDSNAKNTLGMSKFTLDIINTLANASDFSNSQVIEGTILANESSLIYEFGIGDYTGNLEIQAKSNKMNETLYTEEIDLEEFTKSIKPTLDKYGYGTMDYNELFEQFKYNLALEKAKDEIDDEQKLAEIEATTSNRLILGYKDLVSIDVQIENIVSNIKTYEKRLNEYTENLEKVKYQESKYELQMPVHYLYDNNQILGFAKYSQSKENNVFRLVYVSDYYENIININYKDFESDEIESIVDAENKSISFSKKKNIVEDSNDCEILEITDAREGKTKLTITNGKLTKLTFDDGRYVVYYYDELGHLTTVVCDNGFGVYFSYDGEQVIVMQKFSLMESLTSGELKLKELEWNEQNFLENIISDETVTITYNDYKSSTMQIANNKVINYIFDEFGKVRSSYENKFDANQTSSIENCEFCYNKDRLSFKVESLERTHNFLDKVDFSKASYKENSYYYLGSQTYCNDFYPSVYYETTNYHELMAQKSCTNFDSMEIDNESLIELKQSDIKSLVLSGWAKADSAFVISEDEDYGDIEFPSYINDRKFELRAEITYKYGEIEKVATYKKSFDWMNTDWQYCSLYIPLEQEESQLVKDDIMTIKFYFDYSHNTGNALYTELILKEAKWQASDYDKDAKTVVQTSSHSPWKNTMYLDENNQVERSVVSRKVLKNDEIQEEKYETIYKYDKNHRLIKTIDHNRVVTENVYNDKGVQIKTMTYYENEPTNVLYSEKLLDDKGTEIGQTNEFGKQISTYERIPGSDNIKISTDNDGVQTAYGYNQSDECIEMSTTIDDSTNVTTYGYTQDFLTSLKHNDFEITYNYDEQGRNNKILIAGEEYLSKTYGKNEDIIILKNNESFKTVYDDDGNIIQEYYNNDLTRQNSYDGYGNVLSIKEFMTDEKGTEHILQHNYSYDKFGNVVFEEMSQHSDTDACNFNINTQYNIDGNVTNTKLTINEATQEYKYIYSDDLDAKLKAVSLPNGAVETVNYDNLSRVNGIELQVGGRAFKQTEYEYLKNGDHTSNLISRLKFSDGKTYNDTLKYKYDEKGNIIEIRQNNILLARYKYDGLSRIVREDNKSFNKTYVFTYDAGGNITSRTEYNFTLAENLELLDGIVYEYTYPVNGWKDQVMSYTKVEKKKDENTGEEIITKTTQNFEYDAIGNPTTYRNKTLTWSHGRRLDKFADIASYTYNASGIRTKKIINIDKIYWKKDLNTANSENKDITLSFYLNGNKILRQHDSFNNLDFYYGADGVIGFNIDIANDAAHSGDYYYKKNAQNDIIGIYSTNGTQIVEYVYDAWGNQRIKYLNNQGEMVDLSEDYEYNNLDEVNAFIAIKNPFRYRSYYYDFETNLYYLNSRYYDPQLGRFINADDISILSESKVIFNGLNVYIYCGNNPINYFDPSGKFLLSILLGLLITSVTVAVVNVGVQLVSDVVNFAITGKWKSSWEDYVGAFAGGLIGGATFFLSGGNLMLTFAVTGSVETLTTSLLTNATGRTNYSALEIIGKSVLSFVSGFVSGLLFGGTKIAGMTIGRNSLISIWKSGLTKLFHGVAKKMGFSVVIKGLISYSILKSGGAFIKGILSGILDWFFELVLKKDRVAYV